MFEIMDKGLIVQYAIIGIVFVVLVVYIVKRIFSKNKRGRCSCCDSRTCCVKRTEVLQDQKDCCENR